jgi:hypothetical protein
VRVEEDIFSRGMLCFIYFSIDRNHMSKPHNSTTPSVVFASVDSREFDENGDTEFQQQSKILNED